MPENEWFSTIYNNLNLLETDDLIGYWQKHDEEEWTPVAFDVIEKILIERLGDLPAKVEYDETKMEMDIETSGEKSKLISELKTLIKDSDPVFYEPEKITLLVKWIFRSVNFLIILYVIQFALNNISLFRALFVENYELFSFLMQIGFSIVALFITILATFFGYKALGYVLKILKEMELNSRPPGK
jgi:hypothetical protein